MTELIDKYKTDLNELCSELVRAKSENPPGDVSQVAKVIEGLLTQECIDYETFEPVQGHTSVIASVGKGKPSLIFCGHIDVVPAGDATKWSIDPYAGEIKHGRLYGRGATDMKGGVAAMLLALRAAKEHEKELNGRVIVASVPDEEAQGPAGVSWLLANKKLTGDLCVITEPTGYLDREYSVEAGERGTCWLKITAHGKPAHGSTPALGTNAIEMLMRVLPKLKALETEPVKTPRGAGQLIKDGQTELMLTARKQGVPANGLAKTLTHFTVNVGVISGGTKANIVPEKCEAEIDIRVPAGGNPDGVEEFVKNLLPEKTEYEVINKTMPSYTPANHQLVKVAQNSVERILHYRPRATYMAATSDAHFFRELLGIPTVSFGPGYMELLHAYDEFVYLKDVQDAAKVYANMIAELIGER